jgi:hypothetical protein
MTGVGGLMKSRAFLWALALTVLGGGVVTLGMRLGHPNRLMIRNSSGASVVNVRLVLSRTNGDVYFIREIPLLEPGELISYRHGLNDSSAEIRFDIAGSSHSYREKVIDLWTGEGWVFDVQPDGHVRSWYDYPGHESLDLNNRK